MYKIFILDVALLNTFLVAADTDYINAIVSKGHTHLLINQAEVFNILDLKTITKESDCHIRIPKVILAKLARSGSIELTIVDGMVEMKLLDTQENCYCTAKFIKQDFPMSDYKLKMGLLQRLTSNDMIDLVRIFREINENHQINLKYLRRSSNDCGHKWKSLQRGEP